MPAVAPWLLITLTLTQPSEDPSGRRPATTRDLVTWSAASTPTVIPAMAHRAPRDLATAPSGIKVIPAAYAFRSTPRRWRLPGRRGVGTVHRMALAAGRALQPSAPVTPSSWSP